MEIKMIKVEDLKPYANNPRFNDDAVEYVAKSIKEFGFKVPMVIDKNNEIVAGHTRYKASLELGLEEVPCIIADDLTDEQIKAFRLADNKVSEYATWNDDLLNIELQDLDIDMTDFGFDIDLGLDEEQEIIEDEVPEVPEEPKAKLGDIYQLGNHRLMCGDSTKEEDVAKLMNGVKADMVFTDPPYGIDVVSDNGEVGANFGVAKKGNYSKVIADDTTDTAKKSYEIQKKICNKLILWGGNYFIDFLEPSDGWLIWDKRVDSGIKNTFADGEMAYCNFHTPIRIYHQLWNGMIREGEKDKRVHPTQKPIKMLSEILQDFSKENETILDVFGGSGSTLIACEQLNRKCYMMELDEHYVSVIIERYINFTGNDVYRLNPDGTKTNWRDIKCEKEK